MCRRTLERFKSNNGELVRALSLLGLAFLWDSPATLVREPVKTQRTTGDRVYQAADADGLESVRLDSSADAHRLRDGRLLFAWVMASANRQFPWM